MTQKGVWLRGILYAAITFVIELLTRAPDGKINITILTASLLPVLINIRTFIDSSPSDATAADAARTAAGVGQNTPTVPAVPSPVSAVAAQAPVPPDPPHVSDRLTHLERQPHE